ncbi:hypothetical protein RZS08_11820, partial [Arthrospira platensis SPKY1]|nr:hypothetical protein [Arthrospira platensis SPKY1]
ELQGQAVTRWFVQRRRQAGGKADQVGGQLQTGARLANDHMGDPFRRARQAIEHLQVVGCPERRCVSLASRLEADAAIGCSTRTQAQGVAEQLRASLRDRQAVGSEAHTPAGALERRQPLDEHDAVGCEPELALDCGIDHPAQRHHQLELELALPLCTQAVGETAEPSRHRARGDKAQELGGRAARLP